MSTEQQLARQRGESYKARLIEQLEWLSAEESARELGCSEKRLREQIAARHLVAIEYGERNLIPAILVRDGRLLPHLDSVLQSMSISSPWLQLSWLIAPNNRLDGRSPVEALDSVPEEVITVAEGVGVQGGA